MSDPSPAVEIDRHRVELEAIRGEDSFLVAVRGIPPLDDSDDPSWDEPDAWDHAYRLVAAAHVVGRRGWRSAVGPVYERAARGDLYGAMLSPRHGPEQAFTDDLDAFADVLEPLASHPRAGTRQWSVHELGVLRRGRSLPVLVHAAHDQITEVREAARAAIDTLAQLHSDAADALADFDD